MSTKEKNKITTASATRGVERSFIQENQKSLGFIAGGIVVLVLLYIGYQNFYLAPRAEKANNEIFKAESYAQIDSLQKLAISGDGSYPGFEQIAEEYSNTPSANIANAYLGGLYLRQGSYQEAIVALEKYTTTGSPVLDPLVIGLLGDAYSELEDYKKAAEQYKKAAELKSNDFTSPLFLKKLGLVSEAQNDYKAALDAYKKIKSDYPRSYEASVADAYIARAEAQL
ncbi:tetratricopeptide repeat protein [Albibacterium indicum]|uniref:tetratricopeptide repeat protein n=1 Tax=Albibacterium indicum TaxID=2292082 RepID=UPI000E50CCB7|nr:tetratricopeptide repeat protein [Pedobacter indicus]